MTDVLIWYFDDTASTENGGAGSAGSDDDDEEDEDSAMTEIRFVPSDQFSLEPMYKALNDCQLLHPDPETVDSDDSKYGTVYQHHSYVHTTFKC